MKLGKWIGGIMGFMAMGPLGALAGYAIGSLFDKAAYVPENMGTDNGNATYEGQRNSFLFSLLVMASYIIRADGKSCTVKWNLYGAFCEPISGRMP